MELSLQLDGCRSPDSPLPPGGAPRPRLGGCFRPSNAGGLGGGSPPAGGCLGGGSLHEGAGGLGTPAPKLTFKQCWMSPISDWIRGRSGSPRLLLRPAKVGFICAGAAGNVCNKRPLAGPCNPPREQNTQGAAGTTCATRGR